LVPRGENTDIGSWPVKSVFPAYPGIHLERFMKAALVALAVVSVAVLTAAPADAHRHHRYAYRGCDQYDDYTKSNLLSGMSYVYPVANWGPFFRCRMYYSPVIFAPPAPAYVY
jgi:hypothetical protein